MERVREEEAIAEMAQAQQFNEHMKKSLVQHEYRLLARQAVKLGIPRGGQVLDIGTGPGYIAMEIASLLRGEAGVVGLDLSAAMLQIAARNAAERGLQDYISWKEGDAGRMPFPDASFDGVVSSGSLHHWDDPLTVFNELARVLKPGGIALIRDTHRLQKRSARFFARLIGLSIPRDFRVHYWNSIISSFTPAELEEILMRSDLKNWHIEQDFMDMVVVVDPHGKQMGRDETHA